MIAVRGMIQPMALDSGPFALVYPTVLVATLFGHLAGGITAWLLSFLWAWYVILPVHMSFVLASPADGSRVALNALSALVVVVFAEGFRRAVRTANEQLAAAAERRLQLLTELEHRTKNNSRWSPACSISSAADTRNLRSGSRSRTPAAVS